MSESDFTFLKYEYSIHVDRMHEKSFDYRDSDW